MKYNAVKLQTATPTAKASDIPVDDKKICIPVSQW